MLTTKDNDFDQEIAELLTVCGYLKPYQLDTAHALKRQRGVPIEQSIAKDNLCEQHIVEGARAIVGAIKQNRMSKDDARNALYMIAHTGASLEETLQKLGLTGSTNPWLSRLRAMET